MTEESESDMPSDEEFAAQGLLPSYNRSIPANNEEAKGIIRTIVQLAQSLKGQVRRAVIGGITERQQQDYAAKGIPVNSGYVHSIENSAVSHNQKRHGNPAKEAKEGQIAITNADYELIPDILENYDSVELSPNRNKKGNEVIIYTKQYPDGNIYYLEEVRNGRESLAFQTMYKKKTGSGSSDGLMQNTATPSTPVAPSDNSVSVSVSKDNEKSDETNTSGENHVAEEIAAAEAQVDPNPTDAQKDAEAEGINKNGKFQHSLAGLKRVPEDGFYRYRTNPNPKTDPWIITGAMKVNRILTDEEVDALVRKAGREPQEREPEVRFSKEKSVTPATSAEKKRINSNIDKTIAFVSGISVKEAREQRLAREQERKQEAAELYARVLNSQFDDITLRLIDKYIDDGTPKNPYGRRISQRLPQEVERGLYEGARTNIVDALLSRICEGAVPKTRRNSPSERRRIVDAKNEALKGWAIASGNWHTNLSDFTNDEKPFASGTDSDVFLSKDGDYAIKASKGKSSANKFAPDRDNIPLYNYIFPSTAYDILGYGEIDGKFRVIRQFGMMKPTLENPDVILYKEDLLPPEDAERSGQLLFIKTFVTSDGKKHVNFESITVRRDNLEISISSHIAERGVILGEMQTDMVVYMREALLSNSSEGYLAEQNESVPDLVPTQESNASSVSKDNEKTEETNTSGGNHVAEEIAAAEAQVDPNPTDAQKEAEAEGINKNGKFQHSLAGLKRVPKDGFNRYRTNPNPKTDPWIITGAMKVNLVLTDEEVDDLVRKAGREPQVRFSKGKKKALVSAVPGVDSPFKATVVTSASSTKIVKNLESLADSFENLTNRTNTFIVDVAKALGARRYWSGRGPFLQMSFCRRRGSFLSSE